MSRSAQASLSADAMLPQPAVTVFPPQPALAGLVESVCVHDSPAASVSDALVLLPTTFPRLCIHYGGALVVEGEAPVADALLAGLHLNTRCFRTLHGRVACVIVRFTPWGAVHVLRDRMDLGFNAHLSLEDVAGPGRAERLLARLAELIGQPARVNALVQALLARRVAGREGDPLVRAAVLRIQQEAGALAVGSLAAGLEVGERRLERRFLAQVGCSPKQYARVVRFQQAVGRLLAGLPAATVAAELGFSDQAHLGREFMSMAGMTPAALARQGRAGGALQLGARLHVSGFFNTPYLWPSYAEEVNQSTGHAHPAPVAEAEDRFPKE